MSTESFENVMTFARKIADCDCGEHPNDTVRAWCDIHDDGTCKECVSRVFDRLRRAHEREIEELRKTYDLALTRARDPQRLRGTKPNTFDGAIEALREFRWQHATNDEDAIPYINAVKEMHDREIRDVNQQEYHRGYEDGRHSMDAEHRAIAMRLRALPLDGGSHENLSNIAKAIWYADWCWGWTQGACMMLRDELVRLMGGVSDDTCGAGCCCAAADSDGRDSGEQEVTDERLADDCGADSRGGGCGGDLHMAGVSITDELRKWVEGQDNDIKEDQCWILEPYDERKLLAELAAIADRIDKQYDQLQAKLDEYDQTHVELPRDANGEVFHVDGGARVNDLVLTIRQMTLTKSGWTIRAYDEDYEVEREASFFDACAPKPDLIEEIIEKLTLGEITQSEAIERIKSVGQE